MSSASSTARKSTWTVHPSQSQVNSPLGIDTITFFPIDDYPVAHGHDGSTQTNSISVPQPQSHPVIYPSEKGQPPQSPPQTSTLQPVPVPELQPRSRQSHANAAEATAASCLTSHESLQAKVAMDTDSPSAVTENQLHLCCQGRPSLADISTSASCGALGAAATVSRLLEVSSGASVAGPSSLSQIITVSPTAAGCNSSNATNPTGASPEITLVSPEAAICGAAYKEHILFIQPPSSSSSSSSSSSHTTRDDQDQLPSQQTAPESSVSLNADQELPVPSAARSRLSIPSSFFSNLSLPKVSRSTSSAATSVTSFVSRPRSQSSATSASTSLKDEDSRRNSTISVLSLGNSNSNSNTSLASPPPTALQGANTNTPCSTPGAGSGFSSYSKGDSHHARSRSQPPRRPRVLFQTPASTSSTALTASPVSSTASFCTPLSPPCSSSSSSAPKSQSQASSSPDTTSPPSSPPSEPFLKRMIKLTRNKSVPVSNSDPTGTKSLPMRKTSTNVFSSFPSLTLTRTVSDSKSIFPSSTNTSPKTSISIKSNSRPSSKSRSRSGSTAAQDQAVFNRIVSAVQRNSFVSLSGLDLDVLVMALKYQNSRVLEALNINAASISSSDAKVLARLIRSSEAANIKSLKMTNSTISQQASKLMFEAWKFNRTITTLRLSRSGVDDKTIKYLSRMLGKNESLATLDLSNNSITAVGMGLLAEALLVNRSITRLSLQSNNIREAGAEHMAKVLTRNRVLRHLNMSSNSLGPRGSVLIAEAVRFNRTLISLALDMNELGVDGAKALGMALGSNRHLTHLFIPHNNIGDEGAVHLCDALKKNRTLIVLDLELNNIGQAQSVVGLRELGEVLKVNTSLRELNLAYNLVSGEAVQELTKGLMTNSTLESIILTNCRLTEDSAMALAKVLKSPVTGLQNLSLSSNPEIGVNGYWALATAMVRNRSLKGIQLDYNSEDRQQLYESIQNSLTRNHIWQQAIYSAACRILSLSRIVLLGRPGMSREQYFGIDPNQMNGSMQRSTSISSKHAGSSSSWGGKILRRMVGRTNSSNSLASMLSLARREAHGSNHDTPSTPTSLTDPHQHPLPYHFHGHTRKPSVASVATMSISNGHGSVRTAQGAVPSGSSSSQQQQPQASPLASLTPPPPSALSETPGAPPMSSVQPQSQQQGQQPVSYQLPPEYHYHRILPNLGDMPCEIFENICAFLDPGRCMTIAQVRATVHEAHDRSTLKSSMTKDKMLERIFKSRYISPMGTRYNSRPEDM